MELLKGSREELDFKAAGIIQDAIWKVSEEKTNVVVGLTGGKNSFGVLQNLRDLDVPWERVEIFMIDENFVDLNKEESHFFMVNKQLVSYLVEEAGKLPRGQVHAFNYRKGVKDYEDELMAAGGAFDIVLLTVGEDCRTVSLLPDHQGGGSLFDVIEPRSKNVKKKMSASRGLLRESGTVVALAYGESSRRVYEEFMDDRVSENISPLKIFRDKKEFYLLTDLD
jgi:6-phosphogluconolactonase